MAKGEELDNLDLGDEKKSSKKLYIIVGGVLGLLIVVGATLYFMGFFSSEEGGDTEKTADEVVEETVLAPAIYFDLGGKSEQKFIVQVQSEDVKMMQASISVMARNQEVIDVVEKHLPRLRNNILLLLASENPEKLKMSKGKEKLRNKILKEVQKVVEEETGEKEGVEGVYFTGFVMQ